mgnify:CR=1 FL=1
MERIAIFIDNILMKKWPQNPTLSDILYAVASAAVVYYWIHEFEVLNYRAGAETNLDAMISIVGIILSLEVCRRVREDPTINRTPIMMLTTLSSVEQKIKGFEVGADDYMGKPFEPGELLARVSAMLRRAKAGGEFLILDGS